MSLRNPTRLPASLVALVLTVCGAALPCTGQGLVQIQNFKRRDAKSGWLLQSGQLLWTDNNGGRWRDISPPTWSGQEIASVFFLDSMYGWAMLQALGVDSLGRASLASASTRDGGKTWNTTPLAENDEIVRTSFGAGGEVMFVDRRNGWVGLLMAASSASSWGVIFRTADGGATWARLPDPPIFGPFGFLRSGFGWIVGGPVENQLWITRDGARTWSRSPVPVPSVEGFPQVHFGAAGFTDERNGVIPVNLVENERTSLYTYSTRDGGQSWALAASEKGVVFCCFVATSPVAGRVIRGFNVSSGISLGDAAKAFVSSPSLGTGPLGLDRIDFVDPLHGWILVRSGDDCRNIDGPCIWTSALLSTDDGGATLSVIYRRSAPVPRRRGSPRVKKRSIPVQN